MRESLARLATLPLQGAGEFFKYTFLGGGILSIPVQVLSLFVRSSSLDDKTSSLIRGVFAETSGGQRPQVDLPDIEIMPLATSAMDDLEEHKRHFANIGIFSLLTCLLQPKSRGSVRLASSNPCDRPKVDLGLLSQHSDFDLARKAVRLALRLGDAIKDAGFPLLRGVAVPAMGGEGEDMDQFIRHRARTTYHYACTCRMTLEFDALAPGVVDDSLRVHGVANVRVCDASVFPQIITSHLQAPVVMVAEKCADKIKIGQEVNNSTGES